MPGNYGNSYKSIRVRRGLKADIPALRDGEPGFCTDTHELAIGYSGTNYFFSLTGGGIATFAQHGTVASPVVIDPAVGLAGYSTTELRQAHLIKGQISGGGVDVSAATPIALGDAFGKEVRLVGMHATDYPVWQYVSGKLLLNGPWAAKVGASLTVMCLGSGLAWQEVERVEG